MHFFVKLEPKPGKAAEFREELLRVLRPSRTEAGCLSIRAFESLREPITFTIHSEWADEAAFDLHASMPHTKAFLAAAERLLTHDVQGLRTREISEAEDCQ